MQHQQQHRCSIGTVSHSKFLWQIAMADIQLESIKSVVVLPQSKPYIYLVASAHTVGASLALRCDVLRAPFNHSHPFRAITTVVVVVVRRHWKLKFIQTNYVTASDLHRATAPMRSRRVHCCAYSFCMFYNLRPHLSSPNDNNRRVRGAFSSAMCILDFSLIYYLTSS